MGLGRLYSQKVHQRLLNELPKSKFSEFYYEKKLSTNQIAAHYDVAQSAIYNLMLSYGLKPRNLSEAGKIAQASRKKPLTKQLRLKLRVMEKLGGVMCTYCRCDDLRILEVNHKDGGGYREKISRFRGSNFYLAITNGKRKTDDLEVCCRVCNAVDDVKRRFRINNFEVRWVR